MIKLKVKDGSKIKIFESSMFITCPSWSADNKKILFAWMFEIWSIDADGINDPEMVVDNLDAGYVSFARCESNDSYVIYISDLDNFLGPVYGENVFKVSITGGEPTQLTHYSDFRTKIYCAEISPDGNTLAYTMGLEDFEEQEIIQYPQVYLKPLPDGEALPLTSSNYGTFPPYQRRWIDLAWSPDGEKLAVSTFAQNKVGLDLRFDNNIYVVPVKDYLN
jgi:Tol biopolymer transport system component